VAAAPEVGGLKPETVAGWDHYVEATHARRVTELADATRFLAADFTSDGVKDRQRAMAGEIVIHEAQATKDARGAHIDVPSALVHHWRGLVFIPRATVAGALEALGTAPPPQPDVVRSQVLARGGDTMRVFLRIKWAGIISVTYDTVHEIQFLRYSTDRAASESVATRIAEIRHPGAADEQEVAPGNDHGFLWRLNSSWRYQAVPGGIIAECESLTLSRRVPLGLGFLVGPIVDHTAKDSMQRTLAALKAYLGR